MRCVSSLLELWLTLVSSCVNPVLRGDPGSDTGSELLHFRVLAFDLRLSHACVSALLQLSAHLTVLQSTAAPTYPAAASGYPSDFLLPASLSIDASFSLPMATSNLYESTEEEDWMSALLATPWSGDGMDLRLGVSPGTEVRQDWDWWAPT